MLSGNDLFAKDMNIERIDSFVQEQKIDSREYWVRKNERNQLSKLNESIFMILNF